MRAIISRLEFPLHHLIWFPPIVFGLLFFGRPFFLGFVHDDWSIFVVPHKLPWNEFVEFSFSSYQDRPVSRITLFLTNLAWNGSPQGLVMLASGIVALSAATLYLFLRQLEAATKQRTYAAEVGTTFWIVMPWGMGYSVWNSGSTTLFCMVLFLISAIFLF
ncbi:MAG: hypothetical protein JKY49_12590 [Cohaesibacteraceae bacterium]|nr:hypothetical protein [Cohaesibacteraceae bacterium]